MRKLLCLASRGDELAARIALQRVLPGLVRESTRWRSTRSRTISAAFDDIVGAAWIAIRAFNQQRSPSCHAAAIISEAAERSFRNRTASADEIVQEPEHFARSVAVDQPNALEEVAELVASARDAGMAEADLDLVRDLVREGSPGRVARQRAVTPRTIRNHRDRITRDLRQIALAA